MFCVCSSFAKIKKNRKDQCICNEMETKIQHPTPLHKTAFVWDGILCLLRGRVVCGEECRCSHRLRQFTLLRFTARLRSPSALTLPSAANIAPRRFAFTSPSAITSLRSLRSATLLRSLTTLGPLDNVGIPPQTVRSRCRRRCCRRRRRRGRFCRGLAILLF